MIYSPKESIITPETCSIVWTPHEQSGHFGVIRDVPTGMCNGETFERFSRIGSLIRTEIHPGIFSEKDIFESGAEILAISGLVTLNRISNAMRFDDSVKLSIGNGRPHNIFHELAPQSREVIEFSPQSSPLRPGLTVEAMLSGH